MNENKDEIESLFYYYSKNVAQTLCKKNNDYGDSFFDQYRRFGDISTVIRLQDKINRIESLLKVESQVNDESLEDTLMDVAGYAILTLVSKKRLDNMQVN